MDRGRKILSAIGLPAVLLAFAFLVALAAVLVRSPEKESDPLVPLDLRRADTEKSSGEAGARSVIGDPDKRSPDAASPGEKVPAGGRSDGGAPGSGPAAETREGKIARLIRGLGAEPPEARRFAAEELSEMEPKPREAIQALSAALEDPDDEVRRFALNALAAVAAEAPEAIPAIRAALTNRVPSVQYAAAKALLKLGARPEEVLPALVDAVRKERWTFRHFAVDLLGSLGPAAAEAVPLLLILLEEREDGVPRSAAGALSAIWGEDFPAKVASLELDSDAAWLAILRALRKYGPKGASAMPLLARVLDSRDSVLLQETAKILLAIRGASDETLGILVRAMEKAPSPAGAPGANPGAANGPTEDPLLRALDALARYGGFGMGMDIRHWAIWALGQFGASARPAVPALLRVVENAPVESLRSAALSALHDIDREGELWRPTLNALLHSESRRARLEALNWMRWMKNPGPESLAAVRGALGDPDPQVRRTAAATIAAMDPSSAPEAARAWIESFSGMRPDDLRRSGWLGFDSFLESLLSNAEAFPALIEALRHGPGDMRTILAGQALRHAGGRAVPSLMAALERGDAVSRREAAELLGRIGSQDPAVREALRRGMDDPDAEFRDRCAFALAGMDPSDVLAASRMLEWLRSEDPARRLAAAIHFGRREARDRAAIPGLIVLLEGPDGATRRTAAEALGGFGEEAAEAVPAFVRLLKDPSRRGDEGGDLAWDFLALGLAIVPSLLDFIEHGDEELRGIGFQLLRNLGERAESALGKMETLLRGGDAELRESAAATIPFLGTKGLSAAMKALANESATIRLAMAEGIAKEGQRGWESLAPALAEAASKDVDRDVRRAALGAAVVVGGKDPAVRNAVVRALRDPDPQIRREALEHVLYYDFSAETAAALCSLLGSSDDEERGGALRILAICDCIPDDAIPRLLRFLCDPDPNARANAAEALGRMGTRASGAAQALRTACQDPEEIVRSEARKALNRVEGKTIPR